MASLPTSRGGKGIDILCLSSGRRIKDLDSLIEAFALSREELGDSRLLLTCTDKRVANLVRDKGLTSHVEFIGEVTGLVKHAYYRNSDVLCVVSHFESFSLTALEALKYGCAVVATRVGGIPEFIEHEFNGLLVSNGNPNQISAALVRLAKDVQLRHRLVNHGYTTVPRYSMSRMVGEHLEMYESIVMQAHAQRHPA